MKLKQIVAGVALIAYYALSNAASNFAYVDGVQLNTWTEGYQRTKAGVGTGTATGNDDLIYSIKLQGYISGVIDTANAYVVCVPSGTTIGQHVAIISKYLTANPEKWNDAGSNLILKALHGVWPCKTKSQ